MAGVSAADDLNHTIDDMSTVSLSGQDIQRIADDGTFTALQEKINNATDGSTIILEKNYAYDDGFSNDGIYINKSLTIDGNGYTIDGKNNARIMDIYSSFEFGKYANVTLKNINFINGNSPIGGAIDIVFSNLTIKNCTFTNNIANSGGAICSYFYSKVLIDNSTFFNNTAKSDGAAIFFDYDLEGISEITISNSVFNNNIAPEYFGIYLEADDKYNMGVVYLSSTDGLADHQMDYGSDWYQCPSITFINVSYNEFKNQSFKFKEKDLNYNIDNKTIRFEVYGDDVLLINTTNVTNNGKARIDYGNLSLGYYLLKVYYKNLTDSSTIKIRRDSNFIMSVGDIRLGEDLIVNFDISPEIEGYGEVMGLAQIWDFDTYQHKQYYDLPLFDFDFNFKDKNFTRQFPYEGDFVVSLNFAGDDNFGSKEISQAFNVYPADYNMTGNKIIVKVDDFEKTFGDNKRLYVDLMDINLNPLKNKEILIKINGVTYTRTTDDKGQASIAINLGGGQYWAIVSYEGDENYLPGANVSLITVYSTIYHEDMGDMYCGDLYNSFEVGFLDSNGVELESGQATFNINGVFYKRDIGYDSHARLNINLPHGEYIITVTNPVNGERKSYLIKIYPKIIDNHDLVKYYRNDSQYVVKLDGYGDLANQKVTFNINGVFYERYSNESGHVKLNINLQQGDYIITAEYNGCRISNNIKVLPVLNASDLKMSYLDGSNFEVGLVDGQGKSLANTNVTFNINGVFYNRTSDSEGIARLNINLMKGEYIITSSYNGSNIANKITIV
jgi:hypothetical protein